MSIYLKNNPAKSEFHSDPIWNDGAWGFLEDSRPNTKNKKNNKMSIDILSVPDLKTMCTCKYKSCGDWIGIP